VMSILNKRYFERVILFAITISFIHLFFNEYAVYAGWSVRAKNAMFFWGLALDLLFSAEFITKGIMAARGKYFFRYIKYERGWADFLTSLPLLLIYSAPSLFMLLTINTQNSAHTSFTAELLKVVISIRIPQILRALRVVKLFRILRINDSEMTGHHAGVAGTMAVSTVTASLMLWSIFTVFSDHGPALKRKMHYERMLVELESIAALNNLDFRETCENFLISDHLVIRIYYSSGKRYEKLSEAEFLKYYTADDCINVQGSLCSVTVSAMDIKRESAFLAMISMLLMLLLASVFMLLYSWHFSRTVSDVVYVLNAGFRKRDYNLMVKIREEYKDEELYRLARFYNEAYLPAKQRKRDMEREGGVTPFTMDAVKKTEKRAE